MNYTDETLPHRAFLDKIQAGRGVKYQHPHPREFLLDRRLRPNARLLLAIVHEFDVTNAVDLAEALGLSHETVMCHIRSCENLGYLARRP